MTPAVEAAGITLPEFARALNPGKPRPVLALKQPQRRRKPLPAHWPAPPAWLAR